ncbi:NADH-quinone oxidoreductase subunit L [Planctomicrobium piriforme]|uniref:NADH-quinone oxidoreductase subunit L n=1 Tax=Planctomicrobium piriforme TaxID=1576369 RepID=A0A1I3G2J8_9PLAN|nr:NADH-quinone oxidoreductase subunit L [Planctomicrobium piriforme]SFI17381.1 NADH-quinone oxidoreductase subunit L [Planctomicrobium piriforme]
MPADYQQIGTTLSWLLTLAWLLPLAGFVVEITSGWWSKRTSRLPAYLAVGCIGTGFVLSLSALVIWVSATDVPLWGNTPAEAHAPDATAEQTAPAAHVTAEPTHHPLAGAFTGTFYRLGRFGALDVSLDYFIDGLTLVMFCMVTLIAACIHIFAIGYMSDELTDRYEDHFVHLPNHRHFHRPGRYGRFFAFLSLFCFSMLGLVLAGNIFQVFIFWELVGVCSYLLIGFYVERHSASTAANKAFIMNRIGDFGFLIGLMIIWTWVGVFHFAETNPESSRPPGLFQLIRSHEGVLETSGEGQDKTVALATPSGAPIRSMPYWLLTAAGLGIFAGCIGKSAQFPLQTWLPDAMEGPTPVSALVHSATMVAAGVYLAARFYPLLTPEALLVIAYVGCITLFIGATIAVVVTDIKRVLAYSTISQLGYMMLALGVGGWMAGLFHLITHAFFKSLMFLCSGSVIHGCHHEQDMTRMGGLHKKMPVTCWTMFVGVVAICGLAVPLLPPLPIFGPVAFSGYHSKDSILATALSFASLNPNHALLFLIPLITAGITAFYMFRMWFMTFFGEPKDAEIFEHAHESPRVMTLPLFVLAFFAITVGFAGEQGPLVHLLQSAEPVHVAPGVTAATAGLAFPGRHEIHMQHLQAGSAALTVAFAGTILAYVFYALGWVDVRSIQRQFSLLHRFLIDKWEFDALYDAMFVRPVHVIAAWCTAFDRNVLDALLHRLAKVFVAIASWDRLFDEAVVDRAVNAIGGATYSAGREFRKLQTGRLRQYVMSIAFSVVVLFVLLFVFLPGR